MESLKKNIASLFVLQIANYALPLVTLPWLTRILHPEGYGRLNFAIALIAYLVLLADYGFNLSATREIAVHRDSHEQRSKIFWTTLSVKALLALMGLFLLLTSIYFFERLAQDRSLLLIGYLIVIGGVLTPSWYFQGMERINVLSGITLAAKMLSVPMILLFVTEPEDIDLAMAITGGSTVLIGMTGLLEIAWRREVSLVRISIPELIITIKEGWHVFISTAAISLYTTTTTVLLGVIAGNVAVGYYSAAEKLIMAAQGLITPISQSVYPRITYLMHHARDEAFALIRKVLRIQGGGTLIISVGLFLSAPMVILVMFGDAYSQSVQVLRWMSLLPFVIGLSNIFGIQTMLPLGMKKAFSNILLVSGLLNMVLLVPLATYFGAVGAAVAVLFTEIAVTTMMAIVLAHHPRPIFRQLFQLQK